jgi:hypothetical protein
LKRLLLLVLVLAVLSVVAFSWFLYWPLEGSVDRVASLVPAEIDFVYQASWPEMRATGWIDRNVVEHPVHPSFEVGAIVEALEDVRAEIARVNETIPLAALRMDLERDFLSGPVVAAGRFCGGASPEEGPPRWREILLLARVTARMKVNLAALRLGPVRSRTGPGVAIEPRAGYLRIELKDVVPTDRRQRACEGGHERPPENLWYLARVKDVMAVTNSEDLAEKVAALGRGEGQRAIDRPGFELKPTTGGISAVVDVVPLRSYLNRLLSGPDARGGSAAFLGRFTTVDALDRMNASVEPAGPDGLRAFADIRHIPSDLHPQVRAAYALPPTPFAEGIASMVPAKDTIAVAHLETPPENLLAALYESLSPSDRRLWEDNLKDASARAKAEGRKGYASVSEFLDDLASKLDTTSGVAVARLSSVFDQVEYADWFSPDDPKPTQVVAVVANVRPALGNTAEERRKVVDEFLADRVAILGLEPPEPAVRDGVPYSRMRLKTQIRDLEHVKPAYLVFEGRLVLASHEDYLFAILDTMRGAPGSASLASTEEFRAATSPLPRNVTVGLYANVAELRRVLWDYRNQWVHEAHPDDRYAIDLRARLLRTAASRGPVSAEETERINEEVDREVDRYRAEQYAVFLEERRRQLEDLRRLRAAAVSLSAGGNEVLRGGAVVLLNPPD